MIERNRPSRSIVRKIKQGLLFADGYFMKSRLLRNNITESYTIVENSKNDIQLSFQSTGLLKHDGGFVIVIANRIFLTIQFVPLRIMRVSFYTHYLKILVQSTISQDIPHSRKRQDLLFLPRHLIIRYTFVDLESNSQTAIRRLGQNLCGMGKSAKHHS